MKTIKLFLFLILFISIKGFSQADIKLSKPFKVIDAQNKQYFNNGNSILSIKIAGKKISLQVFNAESMAEVCRNEYKDMPKGFIIEETIKFNENFYLIYSLWDKKNETEQLFARQIDPDRGTFINNGVLLLKNKGKLIGYAQANVGSNISFGFSNLFITKKFNIQFSYDKSKMLINFKVKPEGMKEAFNSPQIGFFVFNNKLELISNKIIKMPYSSSKMSNDDYSIDSEGNSYALATVYEEKEKDKKKKDEGPNYHIELLKIKLGSDEVETFPVDLKGKFIENIWLYESPKKYMICSGYYSNDGKRGGANGIIMFKLDKNGGVTDVKTYEFPLDIINQYTSDRAQKKNAKKDEEDKSDFSNLVLKKLIIQDDGSIVLIGEQSYIASYTVFVNGRTETRYKYCYNDILISKIDNKGELAWIKKLPKKQIATNFKNGLSFAYLNGKNEHYLVFLDNEKNLKLPLNKIPETHNDGAGGFLTAYKIDDDNGFVNKYSIFDTRNVNEIEVFQFGKERVLQTEQNTFVVEFYKKKKEDIFIKVKLH